jgi:RNA polymerase sigma-70 factor (sigma-E family)
MPELPDPFGPDHGWQLLLPGAAAGTSGVISGSGSGRSRLTGGSSRRTSQAGLGAVLDDAAADAVTALFRQHHRRLLGLAHLLIDDRSAAEEAVQDAFAGLVLAWHRLDDPGSAVTYLNRSVVNAGRSSLARRRRWGALRLVPQSPLEPSAEDEVLLDERRSQVWQAICALPTRQRQVLVLRYYLDQSEREIAESLGIAPGSVKRHASRALAALSRSMEGSR